MASAGTAAELGSVVREARLRAGLEVSWATSLGDPAEVSRAITLQKALDD